jgi:23S rRNA pseudouridine1911/1915/1917 synthase
LIHRQNSSRNKISDLQGGKRYSEWCCRKAELPRETRRSDFCTLTHPPRENVIIPQDIPVNIVYEDDDLVVVDKEPEWWYTRDMETGMAHW